jgi:hypothetical protein
VAVSPPVATAYSSFHRLQRREKSSYIVFEASTSNLRARRNRSYKRGNISIRCAAWASRYIGPFQGPCSSGLSRTRVKVSNRSVQPSDSSIMRNWCNLAI